MIKGIVAIVGRANVGKSTIFNRLIKQNRSIVDNQPGVTRDRIYGIVNDPYEDDEGFVLIDTGGFATIPGSDHLDPKSIWQQTELAIDEADVVVLVFDGKVGLHSLDTALMRDLQKKNKKTIVLINKVDAPEQIPLTFEFYQLGIDNLHVCSAAHNRGIGELRETIVAQLETVPRLLRQKHENGDTRVALIGRPNAGKSSILNRLAGTVKSLVTDIPGTTRDHIDYTLTYNKQRYTFVDTAGIRKKSRVLDKIESISILKSLRAIDDSSICVLVVDGSKGLEDQDAKLASIALAKYKPLLIVVNKWDLIEDKQANTERDYRLDIYHKIKNMAHVPIIFISCQKNLRVHQIMSQIAELSRLNQSRLPTSRVNEVLQKAVKEHTPSLIKKSNKRVKFYYATQVAASPPTIVIKCNVAAEISSNYRRFLTKKLRTGLELHHMPIRVIFRGKS